MQGRLAYQANMTQGMDTLQYDATLVIWIEVSRSVN